VASPPHSYRSSGRYFTASERSEESRFAGFPAVFVG
jgi:hypothetical protein